MAKKMSSKKALNQIAKLKVEKRSSLVRMLACLAGFVIIAAVYSTLEMNGVIPTENFVLRAAIYIVALVLAGIAGYGGIAYSRADREINQLLIKAGLTKADIK